jgi:hypothetical protein
MEATLKANRMSEAQQEKWLISTIGPAEERGDTLFAGVPFLIQYLMFWFDDRYRAHAPRVANYHLQRFLGMQAFLAEHGEQLVAEEWGEQDEAGRISYAPHLLQALASIAYDKGEVMDDPDAGLKPEFGYEHVVALASRLQSGQDSLAEFKRSKYRGPGSEAYEVAYESTEDQMDARMLMEALHHLHELQEIPDEERAQLEANAREHLPALMGTGADLEQLLLMAWLARKTGESGGKPILYANRVMLADSFLIEHRERLSSDGFLQHRSEDTHHIEPALLAALGSMPIEVPKGSGNPHEFDYRAVTGAAAAYQELGVSAGRESRRQPGGNGATVPGRNDPCPCGSGKKYKKCHGAPANSP